jgi:hypothetical protein
MIRYNLVCAQGHEFESWFANFAAYDKQAQRGLLECPSCGSTKVEKALMTPRLACTRKSDGVIPAPAEDGAVSEAVAAPEPRAPTVPEPVAPLGMLSTRLSTAHPARMRGASGKWRRKISLTRGASYKPPALPGDIYLLLACPAIRARLLLQHYFDQAAGEPWASIAGPVFASVCRS